MFEKWPKRYRIEFIEPGICDYTDDGQGKVFVSREALNRFRNTFLGKPVINEDHIDLSPDEAFKLTEKSESLADGIVYNVGLAPSGMDYADVFIWDLKTQDNIKSGYSASCMYAPEEIKKPGKWHNFLYDSEIIGGDYKHMAIVKNPRYERAKIYELPTELKNSIQDNLEQIYKEGGKMDIFKIFKNKLKNDAPEEKQKMNAEDSFIDVDGEKVSIADLIKCYQAEKAEDNMLNEESEIQVGEEKIKGKDLADAYRKAKKNEIDAAEKKKKEEEEKANAAAEETEEEKKKKEEMEKAKAENKKNNFDKLKNAVNNSNIFSNVGYETREDRLKAGKEAYGAEEGKVYREGGMK